jgi:hypothetical protein
MILFGSQSKGERMRTHAEPCPGAVTPQPDPL